MEIHTTEPLVPGPSHFEVEISIAKVNKYKSPDSDQIPTELIQAGGETLVSVIHKFINSVCNKEELPDQWKESIILLVHKMGDKTDCNNYRGISLLINFIQNSINILLSRLSPCIDEIIGDHQCGFRHNRSTTYQIFCIHQVLEKKWENNETVRQLFIDLKEAYELVRGEVLYNMFIEFDVPMKLFMLIKLCLSET
jgi:hypothetical protein